MTLKRCLHKIKTWFILYLHVKTGIVYIFLRNRLIFEVTLRLLASARGCADAVFALAPFFWASSRTPEPERCLWALRLWIGRIWGWATTPRTVRRRLRCRSSAQRKAQFARWGPVCFLQTAGWWGSSLAQTPRTWSRRRKLKRTVGTRWGWRRCTLTSKQCTGQRSKTTLRGSLLWALQKFKK